MSFAPRRTFAQTCNKQTVISMTHDPKRIVARCHLSGSQGLVQSLNFRRRRSTSAGPAGAGRTFSAPLAILDSQKKFSTFRQQLNTLRARPPRQLPRPAGRYNRCLVAPWLQPPGAGKVEVGAPVHPQHRRGEPVRDARLRHLPPARLPEVHGHGCARAPGTIIPGRLRCSAGAVADCAA